MVIRLLESTSIYCTSLSFPTGTKISSIKSHILDLSLMTLSSLLATSKCFLTSILDGPSSKDVDFSTNCLDGGISFIR